MIKRDKITFLQILTVFWNSYINRTLLDENIKKKLVTKKPTTLENKFSTKDFFGKFNQIHKKM